jgi:hypothetical protein
MNYFSSDHVRDFVGPDIPAFADFGCLVWSVGESVHHRVAEKSDRDQAIGHTDSFGSNAYYFLAAPAGNSHPATSSEVSDQIFAWFMDNGLEGVQAGELFTLLPEDELAAYFGSSDDDIPKYSAVLKLDLKGRSSFQEVRQAQLKLENESWLKDMFDLSKSFIAWTKGSIVFSEDKVRGDLTLNLAYGHV